LRASISVVAVTLQITIKAGAAYAENLGGAEAVAIAHLKNLLDVVLADFVERKRLPLFVAGQARRAMLQVLREIAEVDEISGGGDAGCRDNIFELADISGPGMLQENSLRAAREARDILSVGVVVFLQEELNEKRNIFESFGERWNANLNGGEAIEKIFAESSGKNFGAQVTIGCGDQPDGDLLDFGRADALNFAVLNHTEKLRLYRQGSLANLIEKNRAAVGVFEEARAGVGCAGERAANMTKELALEKRVDQSGAIADRKALLRYRADLVNGARDEFFAGASGSDQQNVRVVASYFASEVEYLQHRWALADDAVEFEVPEQLFFERADTPALIVE